MDQHDKFSQEAERLLDQLVDGELSSEQRRELLIKLDSQTDGWRQCALAFLEAQAWGQEFRTLAATPAKETTVRPTDKRAAWLHGRILPLLAMAASFLVAFALGLVWRESSMPGDTGPTQIAQQASPTAATPENQPSDQSVVPQSRDPRWDTVTVSLGGSQSGLSEAVDVPFVAGEGIDEQWLRSQPSALPPQVLRALERMGHQVERQRAYLPVDLNDGRRVVVPVDQFDVHYVGQRSYQ